jgi:hypothetical protein
VKDDGKSLRQMQLVRRIIVNEEEDEKIKKINNNKRNIYSLGVVKVNKCS